MVRTVPRLELPFVAGGEASPAPRTRTLPAPAAMPDRLTIAAVS